MARKVAGRRLYPACQTLTLKVTKVTDNGPSQDVSYDAIATHEWKQKELSVASIRVLRDLQPREVPQDDQTVKAYAIDMRAGDTFPPVLVGNIKGAFYLLDGFHRLAACQKAKRKTIVAKVSVLTKEEALLVALQANAKHGLSYSNADKRRMLELYCQGRLHLRPDGTVRSLRSISESLRRAVSHQTVSNYLKEIAVEPGDPEDDGIFAKPWDPSTPSTFELEQDAKSCILQLKTLYEGTESSYVRDTIATGVTELSGLIASLRPVVDLEI